ncbi:hypothetical protein [Streptomyces sp. NBC_00378]|uniref:hypothetical protein n=1 Tax=unclassified Streptomyces TaxID=2593676 RepID=UPI002B1DD908|nr:hypothetical protein [Streptomyces sp. NBC_00378]
MAATHCRMGLFGLALGRSAAEWPLETACISLSVSGNGARQDWMEHPATVTAGLDGLRITLGSETRAIGTDLFPPERIVRPG